MATIDMPAHPSAAGFEPPPPETPAGRSPLLPVPVRLGAPVAPVRLHPPRAGATRARGGGRSGGGSRAGGVPHADPALKLSHWLDRFVERRTSENQIRTLTRKLMKSQEDERRMISRELHDRVGQDLSSVRIGLETLLDRPLPDLDPRAKTSQLSGRLDRSILAVRDLAYGLRPPGLEIGIAQAVSMLCRDFSEKTRIRVDFISAGIDKLKLDFDFQINLYRMIQEGLHNVHKHAQATHAVVNLAAAHPNLLLRIEDDGRGFDMEKRAREIDSEKHMGLRSLNERADLLGGVMIVTSKVGKGTRILIKLPCRER
jgi:two-component system, NarL family, sensor kinase